MTHAEAVQRARDAVVARAGEWLVAAPGLLRIAATRRLEDAVIEHARLEAGTCPTCEGHGSTYVMMGEVVEGIEPCPANCDNGKVRQ